MDINLKKPSIGIPQRWIKLAGNYISETLAMTFNKSLLQGIARDVPKVFKVTPVDKGGEPTDPANYCPIVIVLTV